VRYTICHPGFGLQLRRCTRSRRTPWARLLHRIGLRPHHQLHHRLHALDASVRPPVARQPVSLPCLASSRARSRRGARWSIALARTIWRRRRHDAGLVMAPAECRPPARRVSERLPAIWGGAGSLWDSPVARGYVTAFGLDRRRRRRVHAADHVQLMRTHLPRPGGAPPTDPPDTR